MLCASPVITKFREDSIADIYLPLTKQQPYLVIYFFLLHLVQTQISTALRANVACPKYYDIESYSTVSHDMNTIYMKTVYSIIQHVIIQYGNYPIA